MKNVFWMRTNEPDYAERQKKENAQRLEKERLAGSPPTLFDLVDYFADTNRHNLCPDISHYDRFKVGEELLRDLEAAQSAKEQFRIRQLILLADRQGFMKPAVNLEEIRELLKKKIQDAEIEARITADREERDDFEKLAEDWRRLESTIISHQQKPIRAGDLEMIERALQDAYNIFYHHQKSKRARMSLENLEKIRNACYWRALYPEVKIPKTKNAA
ncbi:MAG: hypothetical protein ACOYUZ_06435 [Patescibacteria group bacterium]